jgi:basic membrane protein A
MIPAAPDASLVSARADWSIYLTFAVQSLIDGKAIPADWSKGLADNDPFKVGKNAVYLSPLNDKIAAPGTKDAISKAAADIVAGKLHVFAGPLAGSGVDFNNKPVSIDLKAGDWFHESEKQSAPSWNFIIPGVKVVG